LRKFCATSSCDSWWWERKTLSFWDGSRL